MKKALIIGITGQDGSYLADFLIEKGYQVHGIIRRSSSFNTGRIEHIYQDPHEEDKKLVLHYGDLSDGSSLHNIIKNVSPDEVYNLGAQSHVRVSFDIPEYTVDVDALGTLRLLNAVKDSGLPIRFYQAGSSEMFGKVLETPQKETTPFNPQSPYACAKVFSHFICKNYRDSYKMFIANGILFNHESPRRGKTFVTKKVTEGLVNILLGKQEILYLGNLDSKRDWGYAKDYVEAMWFMLQQDMPDDYVIATGETHSVRELVEYTASLLGYEIEWKGNGLEEIGFDKKSGRELIAIDSKYYRPAEVDLLLGDATKAKEKLGWETKTKFKDLILLMVQEEFKEKGLDFNEYIK
ncbi:MAG: GDP-mannose 4,6-dehydratase [Candidatus Pacebacteria bacterium]|nr:GDP-mannose 4,6-dehydratase [Candidatus Paceibacterota bacterium]MCF7862618.1 GDP-mannose 4,6-dehydratase [Candidatus Paceibacterota bacterium]